MNLSSSNDGDDILECSLKQQFILQTGLDRFVHLAGPPPGYHWRDAGATGTDACFVGLLCPVEDFRVYGYVLTTKVKIIMVVEDDELALLNDQMSVDDRIKTLMVCIIIVLVMKRMVVQRFCKKMIMFSSQKPPKFITNSTQVKIHSYYVEEKLNPFAKLEGPIESETFRSKVGEEVEAFNRALS